MQKMAFRVRCKKCGDTISEPSYHRIKWCSCGTVGLDRITGTTEYRILGDKEDREIVN